MQSNVAILQPLTDLWLKHGPQRDPFPAHDYPDYQHNLWEAVHKNGDGCDYVSEKILHEATYSRERLVYHERSYQVLLIPETETLDLLSIQAMDALATAGGKVVFIGKKPYKSASYQDPEENDRKIADAIKKLFDNHKKNVVLYPSPGDDILQWYASLQKEIGHTPMVIINKPDRYLCQVSYKAGAAEIFFFSNSSLTEQISVTAKFQIEKGRHPWFWDPESGEKYRYPTTESNNEINIELAPAASLLIVFEKSEKGTIYDLAWPQGSGQELSGPWRLRLSHVNGENKEFTLYKLVDFLEDKRLKTFAGEAVYEKEIKVDDPDDHRHISLGNVQGVSELWINGKKVGMRWYGNHIYDVTGYLTQGDNKLSIKVTTIAGNYLKSLEDNPTAQRWTQRQPYYSVGMMGPVQMY